MIEKPPLLIPVPKVASTSLRGLYKGLQQPDATSIKPEFIGFNTFHFTAFECRHFIDDYYSFGLVRNPWDRMVSAFKWKSKIEDKNEMNFRRYVVMKLGNDGCGQKRHGPRNMKNREKPPEHSFRDGQDAFRHLMPQTRFVYDLKGNVMVDFLGRYETFEEDHNKLREELNLPKGRVPISNVSKCKTNYKEFYDSESKKIVAKYYEEDIDNFKYTF
jgi:hypothetical protein